MNETVNTVLNIITQPWFAYLVLGPAVSVILHFFLNRSKSFKHAVVTHMLTVQKLYPDWSGEEKKEKVITWVRTKYPVANALPKAHLETLVEAIIKEVKEAMDNE